MSEENVEIVRNALDAFNAFIRGDLEGQAFDEAVARWSDPQLEWAWHDELTPLDVPPYVRGVPAILEAWERYSRTWVEVSLEALEFIEAPGDRVLTPIRQRVRERESGRAAETYFFDVWTIRDGKVRKLQFFRHRSKALEAAGLPE